MKVYVHKRERSLEAIIFEGEKKLPRVFVCEGEREREAEIECGFVCSFWKCVLCVCVCVCVKDRERDGDWVWVCVCSWESVCVRERGESEYKTTYALSLTTFVEEHFSLK